MSHKKLREEKDCLNCGQTVNERFCSHCGQENLDWRDSAFHMVLHYFQDLVHYDGKFWQTFRLFIRRPGQVPVEYMDGKRKRHLDPIRFYVFASTVFFIFFFFVADPGKESGEITAESYEKRLFQLEQERRFLAESPDTILVDSLIDNVKRLAIQQDSLADDALAKKKLELDLSDPEWTDVTGNTWLSRKLKERFQKRSEEMNSTHQGDGESAFKAFGKELLHKLPQLFFLSLPFFAFFLFILYFRSARGRYVANFIFSVYHYSYLFSIALIYVLLSWGVNAMSLPALDTIWGWITMVFVLYPFVYLFLSMRRFYSDSGWTLWLRYLTLLFLIFILMIVLFVGITLFTFLF